jgi:hypothetical protein
MKPTSTFLAAAALMAFLACGGGGGSSSSSSSSSSGSQLGYSNPSNTSGWYLAQDPASTSTHLVLDLMAPSGTSGQGITLVLTTNASQATWSYVSGTSYATQTVYNDPLVTKASISGSSLRILISQGAGTPVSYGSTPVVQVALDWVSGAASGTVSLAATQAGHLGTSSTPSSITVAVGTLRVE